PADPAARSGIENAETFAQLIADQPATFETVLGSPDDTAVILYTSGTTGRPKGAELTHANMLLNAIATRDLGLDALGVSPYRSLIVLPLFHSFGQTCQMNAGLYHGSTLVLLPRFDPAVVLETMARERIQQFSGVPTMYWALLHCARAQGIDTTAIAGHLRLCSSGGAAMPAELLREFEERFAGVTILEGYGLSETSPVATFNHPDMPRKVGSIGVAIFANEVRVVDVDGHEVTGDGAGEIVIRGHNVMKSYYKKPDATAEAMRGGWFHTGDVGRRDEDGYFFIVDRIKDLIIRGGFNVYPREIEETLMSHPAVSMVAVIGVPDAALGEEIKAFVVLKQDQAVGEVDLVAWCRERMAAYKYPRHVEFRESLPMSATGKILKRELRAALPPAVVAPPPA
ncbi:MAG: AMP-binding protein, partial [Actinobacteria bacterium]|nr:AMP-binding protein [Actinomycetota bacterium]